MKARLGLLAVCVLGLSACSDSQAQTQIITYVPIATAQALSQSSASAQSQSPSNIVDRPGNKQRLAAQVNGQPILLEIYERQITRFEQAWQVDANSQNGQVHSTELRRRVLEMLIDQVIIEQEAQRLKIIVTREELQAQANQTVAASGLEQFEAWLITNHLTQLEFAETLRSELVAKRVFEQLTQNISDNTAKQQFFEEWLVQQKSLAHIERYVAL